jgi:transposase InsO family protein
VRLHGVPRRIISDRGSVFTGRFWTSFQEALGTQLNFSTTYHPETDGKIERTNQILEDMLRMYVMDQHKCWEEFFPLVEFAYNNNYQSTIKMAPFEFLYGRPCQTSLSWDRLEDRVLVGPEVIQEMEEQMQSIRQRIKEAQDRQKSYVDAHHVDHSYEVGDRVFLWVKPHKSSIKLGKGAKLSPRFVGPFKVVEKKGPMAYRLALPDSLRRMHDVFHVSVLRHYISDPSHVIDMSSLQVSDEGALMVEPIHILDHRIRQLRRRIVDQVKVQWDNYSPHSATWEDAYEMRQQFPYLFDRLDI